MNIAIVDDDCVYIKKMSKTVNKIYNDLSIIGCVDTYTDSYSFVDNMGKYHLILLDIDIPEVNGFELFQRINDKYGDSELPYVVFVSNKDGLVFNALSMLPFTFVRKINFDEDIGKIITTIYHRLETNKSAYVIRDGRDEICLSTRDIIYLSKQNNYVLFHTTNGVYKERTKMDIKEQTLPQTGFVRISKGCIINALYVYRVGANTIELKTGEILNIGEPYKKNIFKLTAR
ncbi:MAG: LytTR family DNA-binding domain-containing protein [Clostridiales bacterium]|nr:LytTR family DNA-binding domain-containing protein [Clostridiales bacterium]